MQWSAGGGARTVRGADVWRIEGEGTREGRPSWRAMEGYAQLSQNVLAEKSVHQQKLTY